MEFKDRLKMLREEKGMTQEELARRLGLEERSTISHWEKGRQGPSRDLLVKLSQIFEVPVDYLVGNMDWVDQLPYNLRKFVLAPENRAWIELAPELKKTGLSPEFIKDLISTMKKYVPD